MTGAAEERVLRTIGLCFGVAGAIFGLLTTPTIFDQVDAAPTWWTVAAVAATLVLPVALGALSPFAPVRVLHTLAVCVAAGNLLALATAPLVVSSIATAAAAPWVLQLTALGTTGSALGLPVAVVTADLVLTGALVTFDRIVTEQGPLSMIPLQDGMYSVLFGAVFAALAVGSIRAGRSVDAASAAASQAVRAARDERVRSDERARVNALVHDHVLTALLVAGRSDEPSRGAAIGAADALEQLRSLAVPVDPAARLEISDLLDRLRAVLTATAPDARFSAEGDVGTPISLAAAEALIGAVGEALRNARRHTSPPTAIELHVVLARDALEIVVVDDGDGFDRTTVPENRLGIAASIVGRVRAAGGSAEVHSQLGRGTAVRLRWPSA